MDMIQIQENKLEETAIVFFDLETSGFGYHDEILQIAMKCGNFEFNQYIYPTTHIQTTASEVNGLTFVEGKLLLRKEQVPALPAIDVFNQLLLFLQSFKKPCTLVAHNCRTFDASRLVFKMWQFSLEEDFQKVIAGFADTLTLFKKIFPKNGAKGQYKVVTLAAELLGLPTEEAHTAHYDVFMLEMLALKYLKNEEIRESSFTFAGVIEKLKKNKVAAIAMSTLWPLQIAGLSNYMRKKMSSANIDYQKLTSTFSEKGTEETIALLKTVMKGPSFIKLIIEHLKQFGEMIE